MFYRPGKDDHGLPHDPFKASVVPRPIGWISTLSPTGHANLAPYSQFNNLTFSPPYVMFSANHLSDASSKDSVRNAESTGVFCWNLATYELREAVNITAEQVPHGVDEFARAGLEKTPSKLVSVNVIREPGAKAERTPVPLVQKSPVRFECEYYTTLRLPGDVAVGAVDVVIGRVVGVHIDERVLTDGKIDVRKTEPIARLGYFEYAVVREAFEMVVPGGSEAMLAGLAGSAKWYREEKDRELMGDGAGGEEGKE